MISENRKNTERRRKIDQLTANSEVRICVLVEAVFIDWWQLMVKAFAKVAENIFGVGEEGGLMHSWFQMLSFSFAKKQQNNDMD